MNQELTVTLKQIIIFWFVGFATGAPFMNLLLNIKFSTSVIIPIINFLVMAGISIAGLIMIKKKEIKEEKAEDG